MTGRIIIGALAAGLLFGPVSGAAWGANGGGTVLVSASVSGKLSKTPIFQINRLTLTEKDIRAGFVDVPAGTIFEVRTNDRNGYRMNLHVEGSFVREAVLRINQRSVLAGPGPGIFIRTFPGEAGERISIHYRLYLSPDLKPGSYPWPVSIEPSLL